MIVRKVRDRALISYWYYFFLNRLRRFSFRGRRLRYETNRYHNAFLSERTVEIPVVRALLMGRPGERVLEVGNVLSHYGPVSHDVLDKYEKGAGIIRSDIVDYVPMRPYTAVVCISTLEHIGWDEDPNDTLKITFDNKDPATVLSNIDPGKILRTLDLLKKMVLPGSRIIISVPLRYNPHLDKMLDDGAIVLTERYCFKRISRDNTWVETSWDDAKTMRYNAPYPCANGLLIGVITC
jgi:hypothetical protein